MSCDWRNFNSDGTSQLLSAIVNNIIIANDNFELQQINSFLAKINNNNNNNNSKPGRTVMYSCSKIENKTREKFYTPLIHNIIWKKCKGNYSIRSSKYLELVKTMKRFVVSC